MQTDSALHHFFSNDPDISNIFQKIKKGVKINREIKRCWMNYTDINFSYECWHDHNFSDIYEYSCCYMIENPENIGTWFRVNNELCKVTCSTNSALVFHKSITHTVPPNVTEPRYTLAMDFY